MWYVRTCTSAILLLGALLAPWTVVAGTEYVTITADRVNIRVGPDDRSAVVARAWRGDVFELHGKEGNWYRIRMFSANWRYVNRSLAEIIPYVVSLPEAASVRRKIFDALGRAEARAETKADRKYPVIDRHGRPVSRNVKQNIDYMWLLSDRFKLDVMHRFRVQPTVHDRIIREGIEKSW